MDEHSLRRLLEGGGGWPGALLRAALWLPGRAYGGLMRLRRAAYAAGLLKSCRPPVPVVSVGNLTAGGSGKTPFTAMLARDLAARGQKPAILLRGYRQSGDGQSDEAGLYRRLCPEALVEVGADRRASAERAVRAGATVLLLDDGFQHLKLRRDLDIVLVDATSPWGGGNCLPGGLLREPRRALAAAGAVILTRSDQQEATAIENLRAEIAALAPAAPVFLARHRPARLERLDGTGLPLDWLRDRKVLAVSGIARPEAFAATLAGLGARVVGELAGRDHAHFDSGFPKLAAARAAELGAVPVTTEKDRAKQIFSELADNMNMGAFLVLGVDMAVDGAEALTDLIRRGTGI